MRDRHLIILALVFQIICAAFFLGDIFSSVFGLRREPIPWQLREFIEIGAALGLLTGVMLGAVALKRGRKRHLAAEARLRLASTAFGELIDDYFGEWGLTPAERDVALYAIKGLSLGEIAELRQTSEGTVKAQTGAIYRKAGVKGRAELLSLFIDGLMDDEVFADLRTEIDTAQTMQPPPKEVSAAETARA